jgi:hypothetical protein
MTALNAHCIILDDEMMQESCHPVIHAHQAKNHY